VVGAADHRWPAEIEISAISQIKPSRSAKGLRVGGWPARSRRRRDERGRLRQIAASCSEETADRTFSRLTNPVFFRPAIILIRATTRSLRSGMHAPAP
jgi:hypothetical protein